MKGFDFFLICRLYDRVCSMPIKTQKQRKRVKEYINAARSSDHLVRCWRDNPGFLIVAMRKPRLDDFFYG